MKCKLKNKIPKKYNDLIFVSLLTDNNFELLDYFLEIYRGNYWDLIAKMINIGYCWFHEYVNKVLYYCDDLEKENIETFKKKLFYRIITSYNHYSLRNINKFKYTKYLYLIKYFRI